MLNSKKAEKPQGFTLIELLVVVSIIALLVSILLPALNKARDQARTALCAVNLKQFSYGLGMYVNERNDYLPYMLNTVTSQWDGVKGYSNTIFTMIGENMGLSEQERFGWDVCRCPSQKYKSPLGPYDFTYGVNYPTVFAAFDPTAKVVNYCYRGSSKLYKVPANVFLVADAKSADPYNGINSYGSIYSPHNWVFDRDYDNDGISDGNISVSKYNNFSTRHHDTANVIFGDLSIRSVKGRDYLINKDGIWGTKEGFWGSNVLYR